MLFKIVSVIFLVINIKNLEANLANLPNGTLRCLFGIIYRTIDQKGCVEAISVDAGDAGQIAGSKPYNDEDPPAFFDWRDQGKVTPVKNQQTCAACWAFSAVANVESHRLIYLNINEPLSEQFLIDCDAGKGCNYGGVLDAFGDIVAKFGGILRYNDYRPYSSDQRNCIWNKPDIFSATFHNQPTPAPVIGFRRVFNDENEMVKYLFKYGPLSAGINSEAMTRYKGEIDEPTDEDCDPKTLNHAVLIVGYNVYLDTNRSVPYWIIKNSWGTSWGDKGYYYLVRGRNACGISNDVSFAYVN